MHESLVWVARNQEYVISNTKPRSSTITQQPRLPTSCSSGHAIAANGQMQYDKNKISGCKDMLPDLLLHRITEL
jgi:hypothetical protein